MVIFICLDHKVISAPDLALVSKLLTTPPTIKDGSRSLAGENPDQHGRCRGFSMAASNSKNLFSPVMRPKNSERFSTGISASRAACTSTLFSGIAEDRTTRSAPEYFQPDGPGILCLQQPSAQPQRELDSIEIRPTDLYPCSSRTVAIADKPVPPIPIK